MSSRLYLNKYRIDSCRLSQWVYGSAAPYFVTICTHDRKPWLGQIADKMELSEIGRIVNNEWLKSPELRPSMNLWLDAFVVMPDHFHGILIIGKNCYNQFNNGPRGNHFGPQSKNLASVMRGFKSAVTIQARKIDPGFRWQNRYYDHVIRNQGSLMHIRKYINDNPSKWAQR